MSKKILFIILLISTIGFGQCPDYDKLDFGGTFLYRTRKYIPFDPNISDTIQYCCDLKKIKKYSDKIIISAKDYIIKRAGENFFKNLEVESIEVNYPNSIKISYENQDLYNLENYDVKYWIKYTYRNNKYEYGFGLFFDKKGNFISENKFPNIQKNSLFESFIDPCEALKLVRENESFKNKTIDFIELAYLDEINSFCWLIKEKHITSKLGVSKYKLLSFYINANSGKLEKTEKSDEMSIACGASIISQKEK
jgi:hypothetical protein